MGECYSLGVVFQAEMHTSSRWCQELGKGRGLKGARRHSSRTDLRFPKWVHVSAPARLWMLWDRAIAFILTRRILRLPEQAGGFWTKGYGLGIRPTITHCSLNCLGLESRFVLFVFLGSWSYVFIYRLICLLFVCIFSIFLSCSVCNGVFCAYWAFSRVGKKWLQSNNMWYFQPTIPDDTSQSACNKEKLFLFPVRYPHTHTHTSALTMIRPWLLLKVLMSPLTRHRSDKGIETCNKSLEKILPHVFGFFFIIYLYSFISQLRHNAVCSEPFRGMTKSTQIW